MKRSYEVLSGSISTLWLPPLEPYKNSQILLSSTRRSVVWNGHPPTLQTSSWPTWTSSWASDVPVQMQNPHCQGATLCMFEWNNNVWIKIDENDIRSGVMINNRDTVMAEIICPDQVYIYQWWSLMNIRTQPSVLSWLTSTKMPIYPYIKIFSWDLRWWRPYVGLWYKQGWDGGLRFGEAQVSGEHKSCGVSTVTPAWLTTHAPC